MWGEDGNFTQVPNVLIREFKELGLTKNEAMLLEVLISYGVDSCTVPASRIAHDIGLSTGTTRIYIRSLAKKGFIYRKFHKGYSNIYGSTYSWKGTFEKVRVYTMNHSTSIPTSYIPAYIPNDSSARYQPKPLENFDSTPTQKIDTNKDEDVNKKETPGHDKFIKLLSIRKRKTGN